jgi:hypothetical protein
MSLAVVNLIAMVLKPAHFIITLTYLLLKAVAILLINLVNAF